MLNTLHICIYSIHVGIKWKKQKRTNLLCHSIHLDQIKPPPRRRMAKKMMQWKSVIITNCFLVYLVFASIFSSWIFFLNNSTPLASCQPQFYMQYHYCWQCYQFVFRWFNNLASTYCSPKLHASCAFSPIWFGCLIIFHQFPVYLKLDWISFVHAMRVQHVQTAIEKDARKKQFTSTFPICEQQPCGMHNEHWIYRTNKKTK